jgi:hypothetical protein
LGNSYAGSSKYGEYIMQFAMTLKSILRQKRKHGNSNISPCKNIIFKKML